MFTKYTNINFRVVAARLNGTIDFIDLETFHNSAFTSTSTPNTTFTKGIYITRIITTLIKTIKTSFFAKIRKEKKS